MLDPNDRRLLLESLRPPEGFELDFAVATTFSLDLVALLTAPVAFTFYDWEDADGRPVVEPLALLEALTRNADRLAVFCQADRIVVPQKTHGLFTFLEERVFPVRAPNPAGLFHPKVWVLRYTMDGAAARYRVLVSSRNLTFDRSWDTLLALDGEVQDRKVGYGNLRPLGSFLEALPTLCVHKAPTEVMDGIRELAAELRKVRFDLPEDVDEITFWPLGLGLGSAWPFPKGAKRLVVVAPFVTGRALGRLADVAAERTLISEAGELAKQDPVALASYHDIRILNPSAQTPNEEGSADQPGDAIAPNSCMGLHAKLYVVDEGKRARVWTGSANATTAAFGINVELLVEMAGSCARLGTAALLAEDAGETSFASLLEPYHPAEAAVIDEAGEALAHLVEELRKSVALLNLEVQVQPGPEPGAFGLELRGPPLLLETEGADVTLACRPISLGDGLAVPLEIGRPALARFPSISFEAITSFVAFSLNVQRGGRAVTEHFVLNLPLRGAPEGRRERVIQGLLRDQRSVIRFILMLLADDAELTPSILGQGAFEGAPFGVLGFGEDSMLEALLRTLVRDPRRLERVARLLADLQTGEDPVALPDNFMRLWNAIWAAKGRAQG